MTKYRTLTNGEFIPFLEQIEGQDELVKEAIRRLYRFDEAVEEKVDEFLMSYSYFHEYAVEEMVGFSLVLREHGIDDAKQLERVLHQWENAE